GHGALALEAYGEGLEIRQELVKLDPTNRAYRSDLARSYGYIGDSQRESGRPDEAKVSYDLALKIRKALVDADPSDLATTFQLARSYNNSGHLEREQGGVNPTAQQRLHLNDALEWHAKALELQQELAGHDRAAAERQLTNDTKTLITFRDF